MLRLGQVRIGSEMDEDEGTHRTLLLTGYGQFRLTSGQIARIYGNLCITRSVRHGSPSCRRRISIVLSESCDPDLSHPMPSSPAGIGTSAMACSLEPSRSVIVGYSRGRPAVTKGRSRCSERYELSGSAADGC